MQTKLAHVELSDITVSSTNKMFRDEAEMTETALKELVESIRINGVISPVMLTPRSGKTKYLLVCGERRFRAAAFAGLTSIPANIKELTDDQVLDLQLIENIERKDVHPSKEAKAYKLYMDKHPEVTIADMALKFAKTEHYISIRLKLNDLIPQAMEDFSKDLMSLGHAVLIARLMPDDQKKVLVRCSEQYGRGKNAIRYYETIQELQAYIDDAVICNLSSAAFKKDDANLVPKAGACTTCPKRSGANQLFADMKQDDRCFDPACFLAKRVKFMATQIPSILEKEPDVVFLQDYSRDKIDPEIETALKAQKVTVLKADDYNTYNYNRGAKMKGIYVTGERMGTVATVYSTREKAKSSGTKTQDQVSNKVAIERIKERTKRAAELDQEKIYTAIITHLEGNKDFRSARNVKPGKDEEGLIAKIVYDYAGWGAREEIDKLFKFSDRLREAKADKFKELTNMDVYLMARIIAIRQYSSAYNHNSSAGILITEMARSWGVPVDDLIKEQAEIRKKREARAKERIAELQPKKKVKTSAKAKAKKKEVANG